MDFDEFAPFLWTLSFEWVNFELPFRRTIWSLTWLAVKAQLLLAMGQRTPRTTKSRLWRARQGSLKNLNSPGKLALDKVAAAIQRGKLALDKVAAAKQRGKLAAAVPFGPLIANRVHVLVAELLALGLERLVGEGQG
jgi:hypothetical protein